MLEFKRRLPASVENPDTGYDVLFLDNNGTYYTKDSSGALTVLGNGIASIAKIGTAGLMDSYRITFDDNSVFDYQITNAKSITGVSKISTVGLIDTYRITFNDGAPFEYTVTNGQNGVDGSGQPANVTPSTITPDSPGAIGSATARYALQDHTHPISADIAVGLSGGSTNTEGTSSSFARADHTHSISNGGTPSTITPDAAANQGTSTSLARSDHTHAIAADVAVGLDGGSTNTEGAATSFARSNHTHAIANGGTPSTVGTANAQGTSTSLARADHIHAHGDQLGGTLHAVATPNTTGGFAGTGGSPGFLPASYRTSLQNLIQNGAIYNIDDYGAVADDALGVGGTDNSAAIQAAIDAAQAAGGGIVFVPAGNYSIQTGLTVRSSGITIMGVGCGYTADVGDYRTGLVSCISWRGAGGGVMLDVFPQSGATVFPLFGFRLSGLSLDGRDLQPGPTDTGATPAGIGIRMRACSGAHLSDFFLNGPFTTAALDLGALPAGTIGGVDSHGVLRCIFERFCIRQLDGVVTPGIGLRLSGTATANVNFCKFDTFQIMYRNNSTRQPAIQLGNSDSNTFIMGACNSNGALSTNWGIEILGSNVSAAEVSRANIFYHCSHGTGGTFLAGTALGRDPAGTAVAGLNFTNPSTDNQFRPLSTENGEPVPVFGTGATGGYGITGGSTGPRFWSEGSSVATLNTNVAAANTEVRVIGFAAPANFFRDGTTLRFTAGGTFTNTTAASSSVYRIRIGPTTLTGNIPASLTAANGTTARTNIGFSVEGQVTIRTTGTSGTAIGFITLNLHNVVAPVTSAFVTAPVAVNTTIINQVELTAISGAATTVATFLNANIVLINQ